MEFGKRHNGVGVWPCINALGTIAHDVRFHYTVQLSIELKGTFGSSLLLLMSLWSSAVTSRKAQMSQGKPSLDLPEFFFREMSFIGI